MENYQKLRATNTALTFDYNLCVAGKKKKDQTGIMMKTFPVYRRDLKRATLSVRFSPANFLPPVAARWEVSETDETGNATNS